MPDRGRWPKSSLMASLADSERSALLGTGMPIQFNDDGILVLQGESGDALYVLIGGMVKVTVAAESGVETTVAVRSRGDLIGEFAVLDGMPRTATARAVGTVGAVRIGRASFLAFGDRYPAVLGTVTRSLVAKIRSATESHAAERMWNARERLAKVIYELAADYGESARGGGGGGGGGGDVVIPLPLTQMELGELAGVAVSTTERVLAEFRRKGVIATGYREIIVRDMASLENIRYVKLDPANP